jgi:hypothetical protein
LIESHRAGSQGQQVLTAYQATRHQISENHNIRLGVCWLYEFISNVTEKSFHRLASLFVAIKMLLEIRMKLEEPNEGKNRHGFPAAVISQAIQFT